MNFSGRSGYQPRVMLLGGTSEIGRAILAALGLPLAAEIILAGRDEQRLAAAGKELPGQVRTIPYDALETASHQAFVDGVSAGTRGPGHLRGRGYWCRRPALSATSRRPRRPSRPASPGTSAPCSRPGRRCALKAAAPSSCYPRSPPSGRARPTRCTARPRRPWTPSRGFADLLHGTGVRVVRVRPGFVTGRMTAGMPPAPLATTPEAAVWVPPSLAGLAVLLRLVPRPL